MKAKLDGKVALVGGSTKGIGRAIALRYAENGADIVVNGRDPASAQLVIDQIRSLGRRAIFGKADLVNFQEVKLMTENAISQMGKIDILVANGGAGPPSAQFFRETDPDLYMDYARTRWLSRAYLIKSVLEHMIQRQTGKIVIITTDAGRVPTPGESMVGGSGAAVVMMAKVMAREFARWQIRVNTICTTVTRDTPSFERALASDAGKVFRKAEAKMPFGINKPEDIAEAALFFASEESNQITGQTLSVNGGLSFSG